MWSIGTEGRGVGDEMKEKTRELIYLSIRLYRIVRLHICFFIDLILRGKVWDFIWCVMRGMMWDLGHTRNSRYNKTRGIAACMLICKTACCPSSSRSRITGSNYISWSKLYGSICRPYRGLFRATWFERREIKTENSWVTLPYRMIHTKFKPFKILMP